MRISDWSSDVCSSDLYAIAARDHRGLSRTEAILDACHKRARPIVMTTVAMIAGMLPMALNLSGTDSSFRSPMATAVIGGLITARSEEHTSELQSLMRISYAVFCLKKKNKQDIKNNKNNKYENIKYKISKKHRYQKTEYIQ